MPSRVVLACQYSCTKDLTLITYCCVPARLGLQRTALAPARDETRSSDPLVRQYILTDYLKFKKIRANIRPVLLRQGELGTPQYIYAVEPRQKTDRQTYTHMHTDIAVLYTTGLPVPCALLS